MDAGTDAGPEESDAGFDSGPVLTNDTFEGADAYSIGSGAQMALIESPGDVDHYRIDGTAGQWLVIAAGGNPDNDEDMIDTVITLFDASETQIARNDNSFVGEADSQLITRLPDDGVYYIRIEDAGEPARGSRTFTYDLNVFEAVASNPVITLETEGGDDAASAITVATSDERSYVLGAFDDATDVDVFSITIPPTGSRFWRSIIWEGGADGSGSTTTPSRVWVTDDTGATVIAEADFVAVPELEPSLTGGTWLVWIERPAGTAGANDFYVLFGRRATDNPREMMDTENNDPTMAEPANVDTTRTPPRGFIGGWIGDADLDHWSIEAVNGSTISVVCGSQSSGSGIRGLTADLLDTDNTTVLSTATEGVASLLSIRDVVVSADGPYVLRLSKSDQDATVTGNWYRCGVTVLPP